MLKISKNPNNELIFLEKQFECIDSSPSPLVEAMKYGLLLGGKRICPFLVYATGKMLGANLIQLDYAAAAIEAIHATHSFMMIFRLWIMIHSSWTPNLPYCL